MGLASMGDVDARQPAQQQKRETVSVAWEQSGSGSAELATRAGFPRRRALEPTATRLATRVTSRATARSSLIATSWRQLQRTKGAAGATAACHGADRSDAAAHGRRVVAPALEPPSSRA